MIFSSVLRFLAYPSAPLLNALEQMQENQLDCMTEPFQPFSPQVFVSIIQDLEYRDKSKKSGEPRSKETKDECKVIPDKDYSLDDLEVDDSEILKEKQGQKCLPYNAHHSLAMVIIAENGFLAMHLRSASLPCSLL